MIGVTAWHPPEAVRQLRPGRDGARNGHRFPIQLRNGVTPGEAGGRPSGRRTARGIQTVQLGPVPDDSEGVAADAASGRLHHREGHRGGDGGIYRIAAAQQHRHASLRRDEAPCRLPGPPLLRKGLREARLLPRAKRDLSGDPLPNGHTAPWAGIRPWTGGCCAQHCRGAQRGAP
jgi:hypothetical protein